MFLARLPPELRDHVYKLVLVTPLEDQPIKRRSTMELQLLEVCRQIYQEARHIPYRYNNILIRDQDLFLFLSIIGQKNRDELERLTILGRPDAYVLNTWALIRRCARLKSLHIEADPYVDPLRSACREEKVKFDLDGRLEVSISNWINVRSLEYCSVDEHKVRVWWLIAQAPESCVAGLSV